MTLELTIPELLPSLNRMAGAGKGHWSGWQREKKRWRDWVLVAKHNQARLFSTPKFERVRIEVDRYCYAHITDNDNLRAGLKHLLDGLVAHGILLDDTSKVIETLEIQQIKIKRKEQQKTVVRIYPLSSDIAQRATVG
jgi:Holliday junction resolvase RusA-like endonuclease